MPPIFYAVDAISVSDNGILVPRTFVLAMWFLLTHAEHQNEDYDSDETMAAHRRTVMEGQRANRATRPRQTLTVVTPTRQKAVTFRRSANAELKDLVVTNRMLSNPHQQDHHADQEIQKYGVASGTVNERALGKVVRHYVVIDFTVNSTRNRPYVISETFFQTMAWVGNFVLKKLNVQLKNHAPVSLKILSSS